MDAEIRLTQFAKRAGSPPQQPPGHLPPPPRLLPPITDPHPLLRNIKSEDPIFGRAVVGTVRPKKATTNAGAKPGDFLILTKPIGLGIITTAAKNGEDRLGAIVEAIAVMSTLNRAAAEALSGVEVNAL